MNNYINYYSHTAVTPPYYQRNYERDLPTVEDPESDQESNWVATGKRIALLAVPFLSLYQPFGLAISVSMGMARSSTHLAAMIDAIQKDNASEVALQMTHTALAVMALAGSVFNFTLGLLLTTGQECALSAVGSIQHLIQGEYEKSGEDFLQGTSSAFYLAIMFTGSLEIIFVSLLLQALLSFYQARKELSQEKYPEAAAKILMGMIRCRQAGNTYQMIQRRNYLCEVNKQFQQLLARAKNGKKVDHLFENPLTDLKIKIEENRVILTDAKGKEYDFGSHFHGFGKGAVKGANLTFRSTIIDGKKMVELDFKVNHVFRDRLGNLIHDLQSLQGDDLQVLLTSSNSHAHGIKMTKVPYDISKTLKMSEAHKVTFEGLGSLYIGSSKSHPNLYDRVIVRMDEGQNLYQLHELLSFVNLDDAIKVSSQQDIERLKMGQLFRIFYPKEATSFERSSDFFNLSTEALQQEILKKNPGMKAIFDEYLAKMEAREILPGRMRYAIPGLAEKAYDLGARALTASITGAYTDSEIYSRVASMIKMGMLSSEMRYTNGLAISGLSTSADFYTGAADSVFTQIITAKNCQDHMPFSNLNYHSKVRLLISLEALETGTYQYHSDTFGSRNPSYPSYPNRPGILDFITAENRALHPGNEVMIKERVPPSMFQGIVVNDTKTRDGLLDYLRSCHIVQKDASGSEKILGIDAHHFIRVGQYASESLIMD